MRRRSATSPAAIFAKVKRRPRPQTLPRSLPGFCCCARCRRPLHHHSSTRLTRTPARPLISHAYLTRCIQNSTHLSLLCSLTGQAGARRRLTTSRRCCDGNDATDVGLRGLGKARAHLLKRARPALAVLHTLLPRTTRISCCCSCMVACLRDLLTCLRAAACPLVARLIVQARPSCGS